LTHVRPRTVIPGRDELASLLRSRRVSPVEVVQALLARIDAMDTVLGLVKIDRSVHG
jgi:Asp-tRNA(Asn)/Glu-tRNA(Gln) amidotransferase A subunit family amidase